MTMDSIGSSGSVDFAVLRNRSDVIGRHRIGSIGLKGKG